MLSLMAHLEKELEESTSWTPPKEDHFAGRWSGMRQPKTVDDSELARSSAAQLRLDALSDAFVLGSS